MNGSIGNERWVTVRQGAPLVHGYPVTVTNNPYPRQSPRTEVSCTYLGVTPLAMPPSARSFVPAARVVYQAAPAPKYGGSSPFGASGSLGSSSFVAARKQAIEAAVSAQCGPGPKRFVSVGDSANRTASSYVPAPVQSWKPVVTTVLSLPGSYVPSPRLAAPFLPPSSPRSAAPWLPPASPRSTAPPAPNPKPQNPSPNPQAPGPPTLNPKTLNPPRPVLNPSPRSTAPPSHPARLAAEVRVLEARPQPAKNQVADDELFFAVSPEGCIDEKQGDDEKKGSRSARRRSSGLIFNPGTATVEEEDEPLPVHRRCGLETIQRQRATQRQNDKENAEKTTETAGKTIQNAEKTAQALSDTELFTQFLNAESAFVASESLETLLMRFGPVQDGEFPFRRLQCAATARLSWAAGRVWELLSKRAQLPEYATAPLKESKVVVCGAGPCGLRTALEMALMGADVTVVEKRSEEEAFGRINRVHLWEWCKQDLIGWGAKVFSPPGATFGSDADFCHIGIGELQLLLLKSALLLGVKIRYEIEAQCVEGSFLLCRDEEKFRCDSLILADGAKSPLSQRLGLRSKLEGRQGSAIGVVANFVNNRDPNEMKLRQFSWAKQFNTALFTKLKESTDIDLENVVYYRAPTHHYIVMTPTKRCLIEKGIILNGNKAMTLLDRSNVDMHQLTSMVKQVASFCSLPTELCPSQGAFIFDFSGVRRLESAATVAGNVFVCAVGDALLEPFWPEGLGIFRGFMSALDAAFAVAIATAGDRRGAITQVSASYNILKSVSAKTQKEFLQKDITKFSQPPPSRYIFGHH